MAIVFTRPRYEYASYGDLYRIITLSGFPLVYYDEVDWQTPDTVIMPVRNGEAEGIPTKRRATLIHWMLERPRPEPDEMNSIHATADQIWASDTVLAAHLGCPYIFLGSIETFARINVLRRKDHDLIGLMYWSPRRWTLRNALLDAGFDLVDPNGDCWGEKRETALNSTRLMINAHQDDLPYMEPIKWAIAGSYGMPLLSETSAGSGYWVNDTHYVGRPYDDLVEYVRHLLEDEVRLAKLGAHAWRLVCREHPFRQEVEAAVKALVAA